MRKRHRNITVGGEIYAYSIKQDYECNNVRIFKNRHLILDYAESAHIEITPSYIKEKIEKEILG